MPRVIYNTATTLDGYLADDADSLSWLFAVPGADAAEADFGGFMATIGALVMGSTTYEWLLRHEDMLNHPEKWPYGDRLAVVLTHSRPARDPGCPTALPLGSRHRDLARAARRGRREGRLGRRRRRPRRPVRRCRTARRGAGVGRARHPRIGASAAPPSPGVRSAQTRIGAAGGAVRRARLLGDEPSRGVSRGAASAASAARSSSTPRISARGCRRTTCRSADGAPTGRRARGSRPVVATGGRSGRAGSDHQDGCGSKPSDVSTRAATR